MASPRRGSRPILDGFPRVPFAVPANSTLGYCRTVPPGPWSEERTRGDLHGRCFSWRKSFLSSGQHLRVRGGVQVMRGEIEKRGPVGRGRVTELVLPPCQVARVNRCARGRKLRRAQTLSAEH